MILTGVDQEVGSLRRDLGVVRGTLTGEVGSHDTRMFRLSLVT